MTKIEPQSLETIVNSMQSLIDISNLVLSPGVSFYFANLNARLKPHLTEYHSKIDELFIKYANLDARTKELKIDTKENIQLFDEAKKKLQQNTIIDINYNKISQEQLSGVKQSCFNALIWLIE